MKKILLNYIGGTFVPEMDDEHTELTAKMIKVIDYLGKQNFSGESEIARLKKELQVIMKESPYRYQIMLIGDESHCIDRNRIIDGDFTTEVPMNVYLMLKSRYEELKVRFN